jgi:large subunit ribosomal protein L25
MPDTYTVEPRTLIGKAVKKLRRVGTIPANIYGRGLESTAVQLPFATARTLLNEHGRNVLIEVQIEGEARARPVVIRDIEREPVSGALQHIDFYQVDLARMIQADVAVVLVGEPTAVSVLGGVLVHGNETVRVEALPTNMPEHLEVSVVHLAEFDQQVTVVELVVPTGVTVLTDGDVVLAHIARPRVVEVTAIPEGEAPAEAAPAVRLGQPEP